MSSRLAAHSYYLTDTGVTVEGCNGVVSRQFSCLWTASAQREDASFDTTWPLSWAPQKWMVKMIRTVMAVNIVTFLQLFRNGSLSAHRVSPV